jgi:hypothetical protein
MHADDAIDPTTGDYLYVVDTNVSTDKVNQFVQERTSYQAVVQTDHSILATLTIQYVNDADTASILPQYRKLERPDYEDFVRVFVPEGSTLLSATGLDQHWPTYTVHHKTQFAGYFALTSHQFRTVTFQYRIPSTADPANLYTLRVQRQPGSNAIPFQAVISTTGAMDVNGRLDGQASLQTLLTKDATLSASLLGGVTTSHAPVAPPPEPLLVPGAHPEPWVSVPSGNGPPQGTVPPAVPLSG